MSETKPYRVGYGSPPLHTRFKKGECANPRGRPKGSLSVQTTLQRAAREKVTVTENGRHKTITKLDAAAKQLFNQAASGNARAIALVMELSDRFTRAETPTSHVDDRSIDAAVLAALKNRLTQTRGGSDDA